MKERQELFLDLWGEVDQEIAAYEQIKLGEWGVHDEVLRGEGDHLADLGTDPEAPLLLDEETAQPLLGHVGRYVRGIEPLAGLFYGVGVEIGGEDLQRDTPLGLKPLQRLLEDHGEGIGLLPGRAPRRPCPNPSLPVRKQGGHDLIPQKFPGRRVAEKTGHADQQLAEEESHLLDVFLQVADVCGDPVDLVDPHAPLDTPVQGVPLV